MCGCVGVHVKFIIITRVNIKKPMEEKYLKKLCHVDKRSNSSSHNVLFRNVNQRSSVQQRRTHKRDYDQWRSKENVQHVVLTFLHVFVCNANQTIEK